jgi:orotate phosphoribosyltransferase
MELLLELTRMANRRSLCLAMLSPEMATSTSSRVMDLFEKTGAYLRGHFRLTSGLHSGEYLQCAKVLAHPAYAEYLGQELAQKLHSLIPNATVSDVVSPAMGGIIIGHEVARALHTRALFTERDPASNEMTLRRGFEVASGEPVVVVEDVITTGGSTKDVIRVLESLGARVLAAGSIIDRSNGRVDLGLPRVALETLNPVAYDPNDCPLCRQGIPVVKPGSRRV